MRNRVYIAGYALILLLAALGLRDMWQRHLDTILLVAEDGMVDTATQLESLIEQSSSHVTMLRVSAENTLHDLENQVQSAAGLYSHLHASIDNLAYCSNEVPPLSHDPPMDGVSGLGDVPVPGTALGREIEMALLLAPQFAATAENIPNMASAYYTSAQRFIAIYPFVSCREFRFSDGLYDHEFFSRGRPAVNPTRRQFWTSAYVDKAGKGLMATIGAPVYDQTGTFRGTVDIDLTLAALSKYMLRQELGGGKLLIVNEQEQVLAHPSLLVGNIAFAPRLTEVLPGYGATLRYLVFGERTGFTAQNGQLFASRALKGAPWRLVYMTSQNALHWRAWMESWVEIAGFLLIVLVIAAFETARRKEWQLKGHVAELAAATKLAQRARQEADDANRAKSLMMANVSHDLRTPLNAIIGFSDLMQHELFGPLGERYVNYARDIKSSGEMLLKIIDKLLDLAKIESGEHKLLEEMADIGALVEHCRHMIAEQAIGGGIALKVDVARNLPAVKLDPRAMQRVVLNLLSNAIKFTKPGGSVTLNAWCDPKRQLTITVADTGAGIAKKDLEHLFRPFSRGGSALIANPEGTGLGLSIVKSLVELHNGKVTMDSAVGVGTIVTVQLPAWRNQRADAVISVTAKPARPEAEQPRDAA